MEGEPTYTNVLYTPAYQSYYSCGDEAEPYCENCGCMLEDGFIYCPGCGLFLNWFALDEEE